MYVTLYYLVTRLPDSLRSVRDHFLSLCPTTLTVDLLEERLFAAEKSIVAVGASRGDPRAPFFEGCSPVPLLPCVASATAVNLVGTESVGAASAPSGRRRHGKGKGGKDAGGDGGGGGGGGGGGKGGGGGAAVGVAAAVVLVGVALCSGEALAVVSASSSSTLERPCRPTSYVSGTLGVKGLGVPVPALTFSALATVVGRGVEDHTPHCAALAA
ncbi:unnamed protein product [Closterium sp. NIES-65]|nr:unnamed protein product [Closterium sp. NIES-65]